jgi:hypothetical protein
MKNYAFTFLLFITSLTIKAQAPEKVIAQYFKAIGGLDNWKKIEKIQIKRHHLEEAIFEKIFIHNGRGWRKEYVIGQGSPSVMAFYDNKGWEVNNIANNLGGQGTANGKKPVLIMTDSTLKRSENEKYILDRLSRYKENGYQLTLVGNIDNINNERAILLKLSKDSIDIEYYFSRKTHYLLRIKSGNSEVNYFKYQNVDNIKYPFEIEEKYYNTRYPSLNRTFTAIDTHIIDEVILNPTFNESIFLKPNN